MSKQQIDEVAGVLDEQIQYDPWRTLGEQDFIERDATTEILFESAVDVTLNGEMMEIDGESHLNDCQDVCCALSGKDIQAQRGKQKSTKRANVTKPDRRE